MAVSQLLALACVTALNECTVSGNSTLRSQEGSSSYEMSTPRDSSTSIRLTRFSTVWIIEGGLKFTPIKLDDIYCNSRNVGSKLPTNESMLDKGLRDVLFLRGYSLLAGYGEQLGARC